MLEAKLIEVTISEDENLGIDWAKLAQITTIVAENALPIKLPNGKETGSVYPGYNYNTDSNGDIYEETGTSYSSDAIPTMPFERIDPFGKGIPGFSRSLTAFDVTLDMMLKNNQAEILANSQVVTLNGKNAHIKMVDIFPYVLSSGGVGGQVQVQREEIGIKLEIQPNVNTDGYITTSVTPEVSSIYDFIGPDRTIPWVKKRESTTTIRVKDNESIIIAGLLSSDRSYAEDKVPFLWRLPYLGKKFFTHTVEKEKKTDLIIQITPRIIKDHYSGIIKSDLHKDIEKNSPIELNEEKKE
jgi:type II secretory pathway component GspD/PulD (secretin)